MNYNQTLEFLFQSLPAFETKGATAYKPGLERIAAFCRHLGNPQRNFFTIHVAGTNGKGSGPDTARGSSPRPTCRTSANASASTAR